MRFNIIVVLSVVGLSILGCGKNPYTEQLDLTFGEAILTHLPCNPEDVTIMQPYGVVSAPNEDYRFHDGIDISTQSGDPFYSAADGFVDQVFYETGMGYPGNNYRIVIRMNKDVTIDYHFETGGYIGEQERRNNIFVSKGDQVTAGQHIGNLIVLGDAGHVHFGIYTDDSGQAIPLDYCTPEVEQQFEAMFDQPSVERRPDWRINIRE